MGVAQRVLPRAVKRLGRDEALAELARVVADPEANAAHEWFADVAAALLRERARPAPLCAAFASGSATTRASSASASSRPSRLTARGSTRWATPITGPGCRPAAARSEPRMRIAATVATAGVPNAARGVRDLAPPRPAA